MTKPARKQKEYPCDICGEIFQHDEKRFHFKNADNTTSVCCVYCNERRQK